MAPVATVGRSSSRRDVRRRSMSACTAAMVPADQTRDVVEPSADDVFDCVRTAISRVMEVDPETVTPVLRLADQLGADSLAIIEMVELMEDEVARRYRLRVHVDDVALMRTREVAGLATELQRALTALGGSRTVPPPLLRMEGAKGEQW
ncbi:MAG: hypothetical protein GEV07_21365 [Streptosporangiales bacterium]|nr:hypothetical protein [Streptosporangiales bacterium]